MYQGNNSIERRDFLRLLSIGWGCLFAGCTQLTVRNAKKQRFLVAGDGKESRKSSYLDIATAEDTSLKVFDLDSLEFFEIRIPFFVHEAILIDSRAGLLFANGKWTTQAAVVDLRKRKIVHIFESNPGERFFGHATVSSKNGVFYASCMDDNIKEGFISVRDIKNGNEKSRIPSGGLYPHQLKWIESNRILILNAMRSQNPDSGSLVEINLQDPIMHKEIQLNQPVYAHFCQTPSGAIFLGGKYRKVSKSVDYPFLLLNEGTLQSLIPGNAKEERQDFEFLSLVAIHETDQVLITCYGMNRIYLFSQKGSLIHSFKYPAEPQGIAVDNKLVWINSRSPAELKAYDLEALLGGRLVEKHSFSFGVGSHLCPIEIL